MPRISLVIWLLVLSGMYYVDHHIELTPKLDIKKHGHRCKPFAYPIGQSKRGLLHCRHKWIDHEFYVYIKPMEE